MHMWWWLGYDLGEFMFQGLYVNSRGEFALTWIVLFFVSVLFEGSKVYLAKVQRDAHQKLFPFRSDERRNLLCDREQGQGNMEPTTSRNTSSGQVGRWASLKVRTLVNVHQSSVFLIHNVVGYLLMLAVMMYNVHLLLAVLFGMMLGYFMFGPKLTRLQMQCFGNKRLVICTPECDDTAENTTPPLLESSSSESELFICRTRTCIQPSHYFPRTERDHNTCYFGAKNCPSRVARARKLQNPGPSCSHESEKEDSPSVEDVQLLRTERQGCCKKKQEPPPEKKCCKEVQVQVQVECCKDEGRGEEREDSPQITCCHSVAASESQEQIVN